MKLNPIRMIVAGAMIAAFSPTANAVGYSTGFDEYVPNSSLSGQDGGTGVFWDTNNFDPGPPSLGQSDFVGVIAGYSTSGSDYWALLGGGIGVPPVVDTSYLFRPVDLTGATSAKFDVEFAIISSQSPNTNLDDFGWTLRDAAANQLLLVNFTPDLNQPGNLTIQVFDAANNPLAGSDAWDIFYDSKYDLSLDVSSTGLVSLTVTDQLGNPGVLVVNSQPAGFLPSAISDVAATWTLADTTAAPNGERTEYGSNSLVFNNFSVVPEPSSALFAIGLLGVTVFHRYRARVG